MKTKQHNGFIGYGSTDEEALDSCQIISLLKSAYNASGFDALENQHTNLAPWRPKLESLHIKGIGYITLKFGNIHFGTTVVKASQNLFEMLYKGLYPTLSMVDVLLCSNEIYEFMSANGIRVPKFSYYEQVVPEDIHMYDEDVVSNLILDSYSIVFFNNSKVAIKRNAEELYWVCSYDPKVSTLVDAIYYISYVSDTKG